MDSPTNDAPRQSLLNSINFLSRSTRPRATNNISNSGEYSALQAPLPASNSSPGHRRRTVVAVAPSPASPTTNQPSNAASSGLGYMLRRRRSVVGVGDAQTQRAALVTDGSVTPSDLPTSTTHRIRLVPHLESHRSLHFEAITRDVRQGDTPLRIGRFTDRSTHAGSTSNRLAFKSKVVSRGHAEIWFDAGSFYIKDTKSSSGTFLNHIRLSSPNTESRPYPIKDGDILQLGVDYQGGTEEIYRCVKMRIELGREWQSGVNAFNSNALQQLQTLAGAIAPKKDSLAATVGKRTKSNLTDCCICLFQVTVCQALFIAPCSHVYHYKCIRPLLEMHHPGFSCPLCRTFADLEADVEIEAPVETEREEEEMRDEAVAEAVEPEDVEMVLEDAAVEPDDNIPSSHGSSPQQHPPRPQVDESPSSPRGQARSVPRIAVAIPRRASMEGFFPYAEATPLNGTPLAGLARAGMGRSGGAGSHSLGVISLSDEDEEDEEREPDARDEEGEVGGKRKR